MSQRDNQERLRQQFDDSEVEKDEGAPQEKGADPLTFISPVNVVDLPSQGRFYPEKHPLHGKDHIEIKSMTANEEDILNNTDLVKKGKAIDMVLDNLLKEAPVSANQLFTGDKNAILLEARKDAYSPVYEVNLVCPICAEHNEIEYDMDEGCEVNHGGVESVSEAVRDDLSLREVDGTKFEMELFDGDVSVLFRLLTGQDQKSMMERKNNLKKHNVNTSDSVERISKMIVSINGYENRGKIRKFVKQAQSKEIRKLKTAYRKVAPSVEMITDFSCKGCDYTERRRVPVRDTFFWPDRKYEDE